MRKILIVETGRLTKNSTIAHVRNAYAIHDILSKTFECDLVDLSMTPPCKQYDFILFSYAGLGCDFTKIDDLIQKQVACRIGWITNEFELFANQYVKDRMSFIITNFDESAIKKAHTYTDFLQVNLNTLIFNGVNPYYDKKYDTCYFGTYRKYREAYFQKYFKEDMLLSTSKKNFKRFLDLDLSCKVTDKFCVLEGQETLNLFKSTLYLEDTKTHQWFNYMANRFYEALQCNTAVFFDLSCMNTIQKDAYEIDDYFVVDSYEELMRKTHNLDMNKLNEHTYTNARIAATERESCGHALAEFFNGLSK